MCCGKKIQTPHGPYGVGVGVDAGVLVDCVCGCSRLCCIYKSSCSGCRGKACASASRFLNNSSCKAARAVFFAAMVVVFAPLADSLG